MWKSFPKTLKEKYIYRAESRQSFWETGYDIIFEICSEEAQLCEYISSEYIKGTEKKLFTAMSLGTFWRFKNCNHVLMNVALQVAKIGVFSCGPRPLTKSVMSACDEVNKGRGVPYFIHHFENFG